MPAALGTTEKSQGCDFSRNLLGGGMRALIVCADLEARSELIEALRARFSVDVAAGAAEGRRYISASLEKDRRYSLVVLD